MKTNEYKTKKLIYSINIVHGIRTLTANTRWQIARTSRHVDVLFIVSLSSIAALHAITSFSVCTSSFTFSLVDFSTTGSCSSLILKSLVQEGVKRAKYLRANIIHIFTFLCTGLCQVLRCSFKRK